MVPDGGGTRESGEVIRLEGRMKFGGQLSLREISRPDLFLQVYRSAICGFFRVGTLSFTYFGLLRIRWDISYFLK